MAGPVQLVEGDVRRSAAAGIAGVTLQERHGVGQPGRATPARCATAVTVTAVVAPAGVVDEQPRAGRDAVDARVERELGGRGPG